MSRPDIAEQRRVQQPVAVRLAAREQLARRRPPPLHPGQDAVAVPLVDHGPTCVSRSSGSPVTQRLDLRPAAPRRTRRTPSPRRRRAGSRCSSGRRTNSRWRRSAVAAFSRSASASTMTGVELPSSSETFLRVARPRSLQPTSDEPVNVISLTRSSSISTSPISLDLPTMTFSQPVRLPGVLERLRQQQRRERCRAGRLQHRRRSRRRRPAPTLCATRLSGKLKGEIAPTIADRQAQDQARRGPHRRDARPSRPSRRQAPGLDRRRTIIVCTARSASTSAVAIGLPASSAMVRANSSRRSRRSAATPSSTAAPLVRGHGLSIAPAAASTARRASAAPP